MTGLAWKKQATALAIAAATQTGSAAVLYEQRFDTDTTSFSETLATYGLGNNGISNAVVQAGELLLTPPGSQGSVSFGAFAGNAVVTFDSTARGAPGAINVGLQIGDNHYLFHPGYPGGAFRIEGPGGHVNADMGFTPSTGLNHVSISVDAASKATVIRITDGVHVYEESFVDANYAAGTSLFGLTAGGSGIGVFDNIVVTDGVTPAVPEPQSWALLLIGLGVAALHRVRNTTRATHRHDARPGQFTHPERLSDPVRGTTWND